MQRETSLVLIQEEPRGPSILIEIPVTANNQQKVKLPDVQQLRSQEGQTIIIKGIRLITNKVLTNGVTVEGVNATLAELRKISLTLYSEGWLKGNTIPILTLNDLNDSDAAVATTIPFRNRSTKFDNWRNVDWAQSYLQYSNGTSSANTPYVVMLEVQYIKLNAAGQEIMGPS